MCGAAVEGAPQDENRTLPDAVGVGHRLQEHLFAGEIRAREVGGAQKNFSGVSRGHMGPKGGRQDGQGEEGRRRKWEGGGGDWGGREKKAVVVTRRAERRTRGKGGRGKGGGGGGGGA